MVRGSWLAARGSWLVVPGSLSAPTQTLLPQTLKHPQPTPCCRTLAVPPFCPLYINSDGCGSRYHFAASPQPTPITSTTDLSHTEAQRLRGFYLGAAPPAPRFCMTSPGVSNKRRGDGVPRVRSGGLVAVRVILCSTSDRIQVARVNQFGCPKRGRRRKSPATRPNTRSPRCRAALSLLITVR